MDVCSLRRPTTNQFDSRLYDGPQDVKLYKCLLGVNQIQMSQNDQEKPPL